MFCKRLSVLFLILTLTSVLISSVSCGRTLIVPSVSSSGDVWTVGAGACEIPVPDVSPLYIAGYKNDNPMTGVLDPMYVRALWLDDNSGEGGTLLISVDCVGLSGKACDAVKLGLRKLIDESGCRAVHVSSTHTHAGIDTLGLWGKIALDSKSDVFMAGLYDSAVSAAELAYKNRSEGKLYYGSCDVSELLRDSRPPEIVDGKMSLFKFESESGADAAAVVLGAHPESLGSSNSLVSADFASVICAHLSDKGYSPLFFAGAVGGLISTVRQSYDSVNNMTLTGERLCEKLDGITDFRELSPSLLTDTEKVEIPLDNGIFAALTFLGTLDVDAVKGSSGTGLAVSTSVSYLRLGDGESSVGIAMVPGEAAPEVMSEIKELFNGETITVGLCDDEIGYILPKEGFLISAELPYLEEAVDDDGEGHYEETNSVGPEVANSIAGAFSAISSRNPKL